MKRMLFVSSLFLFLLNQLSSQSVGIGTSSPNPAAILHIDLDTNSSKGFLITGDLNTSSSVIPNLSPNSMLFFFPGKAAFRAGYSGFGVVDADIGSYSTAFGSDVKASGLASIAMGTGTIASNSASMAMGAATTSSGFASTSMGYTTTASGDYSIAMGEGTIAGGYASFTIGSSSTASGDYSTAIGFGAIAGGYNSTAIGTNVKATGDYSVAIGENLSTDLKTGSFFFGDSDPHNRGERIIGTPDQIAMRFNGGYYFISSNATDDIGVQILPGGNSWTVASDVRRKENFLPVDGESFLKKIAALNLTSWNYKAQDPKTFRHYGPMAQDFYAAFGKDDLGTIGCDTLINQQDFLGVDLIAIQALEKRTETIKTENEELKEMIVQMKKEINELKKKSYKKSNS